MQTIELDANKTMQKGIAGVNNNAGRAKQNIQQMMQPTTISIRGVKQSH